MGIGAYAVQPFRRDGERAVCLAITEAFPRKWTAYEMHILDDVVARVWPLVEHARNEQSLLESEKRFRALVTASSDVVYRMNADWSEMRQLDGRNFVNDTDGTSRTWFTDNIHAADQPQVRAVINEAIRTKSNFELEHRVRRVDGSFGWTFSRAIPQLDAKGEITEWFGAASDVSGRKEADDQLRAAHDSFRHLVEQSPFGIYAVDADFRLVLVSAGAQKVFENVRPLIGRDFAEVLRLVWPEPFVTQALTIFRRVLASGEPYHAPSTVEKRQDTAAEESYDWKVERITLPDGRPGAVCHFYDLSERKKAEDALRASVQRLRFMAESMPQKIFTAKPNGDTDYGNRQWLKFTGLTLEQIKDWGWTQFIHPEDVEETVRHWK